MEIENTDMTVNMYMLLLSRMKGKLSSSYAFGSQALKDSFWDIVMDASTGQTYDDYYTDMVLENAKTYLAALYLFDDLDLKREDIGLGGSPTKVKSTATKQFDKTIETVELDPESAAKAIIDALRARHLI